MQHHCYSALLLLWVYSFLSEHWPKDTEPIPPEEIKLWCQWQLEGKASMLGLDANSVSQDEVENYYAQVNIMTIVSGSTARMNISIYSLHVF